ncbi:MAG: putative phosphoesterase [Marinoscillum sp.]
MKVENGKLKVEIWVKAKGQKLKPISLISSPMRIGLLSDTHGHLDDSVFGYFDKCEEIWHAGDIGTIEVLQRLETFRPIRAVFGNVDGHELRAATPEYQIFSVEGVKVVMTHIGGKPPQYTPQVRTVLTREYPRLFICGHSHILKVEQDKFRKMLCMNPGAAGKHGFHKVKTLLRFDISDARIHNLEVVELGLRASLK